jgi:hypothetical protein
MTSVSAQILPKAPITTTAANQSGVRVSPDFMKALANRTATLQRPTTGQRWQAQQKFRAPSQQQLTTVFNNVLNIAGKSKGLEQTPSIDPTQPTAPFFSPAWNDINPTEATTSQAIDQSASNGSQLEQEQQAAQFVQAERLEQPQFAEQGERGQAAQQLEELSQQAGDILSRQGIDTQQLETLQGQVEDSLRHSMVNNGQVIDQQAIEQAQMDAAQGIKGLLDADALPYMDPQQRQAALDAMSARLIEQERELAELKSQLLQQSEPVQKLLKDEVRKADVHTQFFHLSCRFAQSIEDNLAEKTAGLNKQLTGMSQMSELKRLMNKYSSHNKLDLLKPEGSDQVEDFARMTELGKIATEEYGIQWDLTGWKTRNERESIVQGVSLQVKALSDKKQMEFVEIQHMFTMFAFWVQFASNADKKRDETLKQINHNMVR